MTCYDPFEGKMLEIMWLGFDLGSGGRRHGILFGLVWEHNHLSRAESSLNNGSVFRSLYPLMVSSMFSFLLCVWFISHVLYTLTIYRIYNWNIYECLLKIFAWERMVGLAGEEGAGWQGVGKWEIGRKLQTTKKIVRSVKENFKKIISVKRRFKTFSHKLKERIYNNYLVTCGKKVQIFLWQNTLFFKFSCCGWTIFLGRR